MKFWVRHTFDRPLETMNITVVASSLISLMLSHQRNQFLGRPAFSLEIIVIRSRSTSVHLVSKSAISLPWIKHPLTIKLIEEPPPRI
jgi:hypothetical protein